MKIAVNGYYLTRPGTGFDTYTRGLLDAFAVLAPSDRFIIYIPWAVDYRAPANMDIVIIPPLRRLPESVSKFCWEQIRLPKVAKKTGVDILHHFYPNYSLFSGALPQVVSIHDAIPWERPRDYQYSILAILLRWFIRVTVPKARAIITVSKTSQASIAKIFKIDKDKITVAYNGIDERFRTPLPSSDQEEVVKKYSIPKPYILYVGGFDIRKNVGKLVDAFTRLAPNIPHDLVLPGAPGPQKKLYQDYFLLPEKLKKENLARRVHLPGRVSVDELRALYSQADIFVMLSESEGFNMNVIEAMASGVSVIASKTSSTGEILGAGFADQPAVLVDPNNGDQVVGAIEKLINDPKRKHELAEKGKKWQLKYSFKQAGEEILAVYRKICK